MTSGYPEAFEYAVERTLKAEGGPLVTNYDWDPGGTTKYGITQKYNPEVDVPNLTEKEAIDVYYRKYWKPLRLGEVSSKYVAAEIFDTAVNMGLVPATKIAQEAVNLLEAAQVLVVDGRLGPITLGQLNAIGDRYEKALVVSLNLVQGMYYIRIIKSNPALGGKVAKGWMKRLCPPAEILE